MDGDCEDRGSPFEDSAVFIGVVFVRERLRGRERRRGRKEGIELSWWLRCMLRNTILAERLSVMVAKSSETELDPISVQ